METLSRVEMPVAGGKGCYRQLSAFDDVVFVRVARDPAGADLGNFPAADFDRAAVKEHIQV